MKARAAIKKVYRGVSLGGITGEEYLDDIRDVLTKMAAKWEADGRSGRSLFAMEEVKRLDIEFGLEEENDDGI